MKDEFLVANTNYEWCDAVCMVMCVHGHPCPNKPNSLTVHCPTFDPAVWTRSWYLHHGRLYTALLTNGHDPW